MRHLLTFLEQSPDGLLFGPGLDTVTSTGTAIGATLAATAAVAGDSLTIKAAAPNSDVWLLNFWADNQAAGQVRIRSPRMHDNVDSIRSRVRVNNLEPLLPWGQPQKLYSQDTEVVELAGSAVAGDIESVVQMIYYNDLPGTSARFIDPAALKQRGRNYLGNRVAITVGSTAAYSGARALNADVDLMKANIDYAVLGITSDIRLAAICLRGPDTGNLRVPVPGGADVQGSMKRYGSWFRDLSFFFMLPLVPVINAANKGATLIDVVGDENGGTANVTVWLCELG